MPRHSHIGSLNGVVQIAIAHDHRLFRDGVRRLLHDVPHFKLVGEASNGQEALLLTMNLRTDVLLLDGLLPSLGAVPILKEIMGSAPSTRCVLFAEETDSLLIDQALRMDVRAILSKSVGVSNFVEVIRHVASGEYWISRNLLADTLRRERHCRNSSENLTEREMEIIAEISAGACNLAIAQKMGISQETVKKHLSNVFQKLGVCSRLELAIRAMQMGLRTPPSKSQAMGA